MFKAKSAWRREKPAPRESKDNKLFRNSHRKTPGKVVTSIEKQQQAFPNESLVLLNSLKRIDNSIFSQTDFEMSWVPSFSNTKLSDPDAVVLNPTVKIETVRFEDSLLETGAKSEV